MLDETARLVQDASCGDRPAIDRLFVQYAPELRAFFRLRLGPQILAHESPDDMVQTVFREVIQDLSDFEYRDPQSFKKWLFLTAYRKIKDRARFYKAEKRDAGRHRGLESGAELAYESVFSPSRVAMGREEIVRLEAAFDKLSEDHQTVITCSRILGMSHAEIAEEMGSTPGATRVLLHRALAKLGTLIALDRKDD